MPAAIGDAREVPVLRFKYSYLPNATSFPGYWQYNMQLLITGPGAHNIYLPPGAGISRLICHLLLGPTLSERATAPILAG